jgi:hypothetical protein
MEGQKKNNRNFVLILIIIVIILIISSVALLYNGQKISNEAQQLYLTITSVGDPFEDIGSVDTWNILSYIPSEIMPFYIRFSWEIFFVIPSIFILICSVLTFFSACCIYLKKRKKLVSIGLNFSIAGTMMILYLPLSFFTGRLWLFTNIELYHIYLLFLVELLIIGIIAIFLIFLMNKTKQRLLATYY